MPWRGGGWVVRGASGGGRGGPRSLGRGTPPKEDLGLRAKLSQQHLLADRREMHATGVEDVTDADSSRTDQAVAGEVLQLPLVGAHRPVEPNGVVERPGS